MIRITIGLVVFSLFVFALDGNCRLPSNLVHLEKKVSLNKLLNNSDVRRNAKQLKNMCMHLLSFKEAKYSWKMLLVYNPKQTNGLFWYLPHDNEDSAFDSAVYATENYGGGFLAVLANNKRYFMGQDPNRNFGTNERTAKICRKQHYPAPMYGMNVIGIIDTFRGEGMPYLALHNNKNGWYKNGGTGGVSILKSSKLVQSYPSGKVLTGVSKGLKDEDSLIYIAGKNKYPSKTKIQRLLDAGIHVKYEVVSSKRNDCSMSNYIVLNKGNNYYNIETEHGDSKTQKNIIKKLVNLLGYD